MQRSSSRWKCDYRHDSVDNLGFISAYVSRRISGTPLCSCNHWSNPCACSDNYSDIRGWWLGCSSLTVGYWLTRSLIQLGFNSINGSIPTTLGAMTALQYLDLQSLKITGTLPASVGNLTNLSVVQLANNALSSSLPTTLRQLTLLV